MVIIISWFWGSGTQVGSSWASSLLYVVSTGVTWWCSVDFQATLKNPNSFCDMLGALVGKMGSWALQDPSSSPVIWDAVTPPSLYTGVPWDRLCFHQAVGRSDIGTTLHLLSLLLCLTSLLPSFFLPWNTQPNKALVCIHFPSGSVARQR